MLTYQTPDQLAQDVNKQEQQSVDDNKISNGQSTDNQPLVNSIAGYVNSKWEVAKNHKMGINTRLIDCLRRRKGEYSPTKLAEIRGSEIYMKITAAKCIGAKAWLSDLFGAAGDKPFSLKPTPVSELPPEIHENLIMQAMQGAMQLGLGEEDAYAALKQNEERLKQELQDEAEKRMEKMEDYIHDMMVESNWRNTFAEFLDDLVTYPTAIISGINFKNRKKVQWVDVNGEFVPQEKMQVSKEFNRVSPFDAYPSPNMMNGKCNWFIEHVRYSAKELSDIRDTKGYDKDAIYRVLTDYRANGYREWLFNDAERDALESGRSTSNTNYELIDGIKFSGTLAGSQLTEWGMQGDLDPVKEYAVSFVKINNYIIRAIINPDPAATLNYFYASWRTVPNSFWGESLPETISDQQDGANATMRALMNNMALGASPQFTYDISKSPNGTVPAIKPMTMYAYDSSKNGMSTGAGIGVFQFDIRANELLSTYERFVRYADEISGIPSYAFGSDSGAGAAKTASGLSMLMNAAGKNMKGVVRQVDIGVIEPAVSHAYNIAMLDKETPKDVKGDAKVVARGSDALMHKESMAMRQQELLMTLNNPTDMQITGLNGRRELLKTVLKSSDISADKILMSPEEMQQQQMAMQEQAMAQGQP